MTSGAAVGDGVKGTITNSTGERIIVSSRYSYEQRLSDVGSAILEPGGTTPYRLLGFGTLQFSKAPEGVSVGTVTKLLINDDLIGPETQFTPPRWKGSVTTREGWKEDRVTVRPGGRSVCGSNARSMAGIVGLAGVPQALQEPNFPESSDWAIIMIIVNSL
jgi:hypothetical protein